MVVIADAVWVAEEELMDNGTYNLNEWRRKSAKLKIIEKTLAFIGIEYQRLGGEIFSDYLFVHQDINVQELVKLLDRLSTDNVNQDISPKIVSLQAHADFLLELDEVRKDLITIIKELQPPTHKEAPIPNANS